MSAKVLLIGSGAREHALALKLNGSSHVSHVFVSPGNAGTARSGDRVSNIDLDVNKNEVVVDWCIKNSINLVIVGPEDPLANGITDSLTAKGIACFGPSAKAALIESSKEFAKKLMTENKIPTAGWKSFTSPTEACDFINNADFPALVVKASGLAAGKGVVVAKDKQEACDTVKDIFQNRTFGEAGDIIVIEEMLEGNEISCLAFTDGTTVSCMPPAQDHKRLLEGDQGPNTGGMGAYCPCPLITDEQMEFVKKEILQKTVDALKAAGSPFVGVLYAGIMLTKSGPKVLEFNCRFGDPETQVLLQLLKTDLYEVVLGCVNGTLNSISVEFSMTLSAVGIVLASGGYPNAYEKNIPITGIEEAERSPCTSVFIAGAVLTSDGEVKTSGGRVMTVVGCAADIRTAADMALRGVDKIKFRGKMFRKDIAHRALKRDHGSITYKDSGVDIEAGDDLVSKIKPLAAATWRSGCVSDLGLFGGLFDLKAVGYTDPLLVSGTDGVGTKLKIAEDLGIHDTVGVDLVAMCVNDVLCHGAEPLFFLDYFACGKLDVSTAHAVIKGISDGCKQAQCVLIGGETAEMPGMYSPGDYDLAGFSVGAVERSQYLPRVGEIGEGDVVIGLQSSGVHSNGFSLVRKILETTGHSYQSTCPYDTSLTIGQSLLVPTRIYVKCLLPVMKAGLIKAAAHITGGGLPGNLVRVLPDGFNAVLDASCWEMKSVFGFLSHLGRVAPSEMLKTFNCGIGMTLVINKSDEQRVLNMLKETGEKAWKIGSIVKHEPGMERVEVRGISKAFEDCFTEAMKSNLPNYVNGMESRKRVAVLISESGTNLQSLIDKVHKNPKSSAGIALVVSNSASAFGLKRAESAGIATVVINHKDYKSREEFDEAMHAELVKCNIDIVCLAGFMRILSSGFVRKWVGRMLNIHPSLLPSFKGAHAHRLALEAGVRVTGCTVHFVAEEVDSGAIITQRAVEVKVGDTEDSLSERVKTAEHEAFPEALNLLSAGKVKLGQDGRLVWL